MLVLTRKEGETIRIGDDIEIVVRRISGNRITVGVSAPRDVRILRGELEQFDEPIAPALRTRRNGRIPADVERDSYAIVQGRIPRSPAAAISKSAVR